VDCAAKEYLRTALDITADCVPFGALGDMYIMPDAGQDSCTEFIHYKMDIILTGFQAPIIRDWQ